MHPAHDRGHNMLRRVVDDGLNGVEPQSVDMELVDPIAGVADKEIADRAGRGGVEVDRFAPLGVMLLGNVVARVEPRVVTHRTEVVVNHIEQHAEPAAVGRVDKATKIVGLAVQPSRREQLHAVVAPAEVTGKLGDRHDFQQGDAKPCQLRQLLQRRPPGPGGREGADVHFVDHLAM